jgi:hypothetical protein
MNKEGVRQCNEAAGRGILMKEPEGKKQGTNERQAEEFQARYTPLIVYTCSERNTSKVNIRTRLGKEGRARCSRLPGGASRAWPLPSGPNCPIIPASSTNHDPHNLSKLRFYIEQAHSTSIMHCKTQAATFLCNAYCSNSDRPRMNRR